MRSMTDEGAGGSERTVGVTRTDTWPPTPPPPPPPTPPPGGGGGF
jgi:hypothetical protein